MAVEKNIEGGVVQSDAAASDSPRFVNRAPKAAPVQQSRWKIPTVYTLEDLREAAPDDLLDVSDEQLVYELASDTGRDPRELAEYFGMTTGNQRGDITAGLAAGVDQLQGLLYSAGAGAADIARLDSARDYLNRRAESQEYEAYFAGKPERERVEDIGGLGDAIDWAQYQTARAIPTIAATVASQFLPGAGQAATATGLARLGAIAPRGLGGGGFGSARGLAAQKAAIQQGRAVGSMALSSSAIGFGDLYQASGADGEYNPYAALAMTPLYAASEAVVPALISRGIRAPQQFTGNVVSRVGKASGVGAVTEAGTEGFQTFLTRAIDSTATQEEAASEYLNAILAGGVAGGVLSSVGGIRRPDEVPEKAPVEDNELGERDLAPAQDKAATLREKATKSNEAVEKLRATIRTKKDIEAFDLRTREAIEAFDLDNSEFTKYTQQLGERIRPGSGVTKGQRRKLERDISVIQQEVARLQAEADRIPARPKAIKGMSAAARKKRAEQLASQRAGYQNRIEQVQAKIVPIQARIDESLQAEAARSQYDQLRQLRRKLEFSKSGIPIVSERITSADLNLIKSIDPVLYDALLAANPQVEAVAQGEAAPIDLGATAEQATQTEPTAEVDLTTPVQQTAEPVQQTAEPVQQTAAPTQQAAEEAAAQDSDVNEEVYFFDQLEQDEMFSVLDSIDNAVKKNSAAAEQTVTTSGNRLNAQVLSERTEGPKGITLPKRVMLGALEMIRNPAETARSVVRKRKSVEVDQELLAEYNEQLQNIRSAWRNVASVASALADATSVVDRGKTDYEARLDAKNRRLQSYSRKPVKTSDAEMQRGLANVINLRRRLRESMDSLVQAAGGAANVEALIAIMKLRKELNNRSAYNNKSKYVAASQLLGKTGKAEKIVNQKEYEDLLDILVSSSFVEYKDGTLSENTLDVVRNTETRNNFYEKKIDLDVPLVNAVNKKGLLGALEYVGSFQGTTSAYAKSIAQVTRRAIIKLQETAKQEVNVVLFDRQDEKDPNVFSYYDPNDGPVGTIYLAKDASQEEVLHESLHAALQWYVSANPDSPFVTDLLKSLDTVIKFADDGGISRINDMSEQYIAEATEVVELLKALRESSPTDAALELVSYGLTMRSFKELIKRVDENPSPETATWLEVAKGLWTSLVNLFAKFLGVQDKVANNVINNSLALLQQAADALPQSKAGQFTSGNRLFINRMNPEFIKSNEAPTNRAGNAVGERLRNTQRRAYDDWFIGTKIIFDKLGWKKFWGTMNPDGTITPGILQEKAGALADKIRSTPNSTLARMITLFNANFMQTAPTRDSIETAKLERSAPYQVVSTLTNAMRNWKPEKVAALIRLLDYNDDSAITKYKDHRKWVKLATHIRDKLLPELTSRLSDEESARYFDLKDKKFTDAMIQVTSDKSISKQSFGLVSLSAQIKANTIKVSQEAMEGMAGALLNYNADGTADLSGEFYRIDVVVDEATGDKYSTFVSVDKYEVLDGDVESVYAFGGAVRPVDTTQVYRYNGFYNNAHRFSSRKSYSDAVDRNKADTLINAIENTFGGLTNNYASVGLLRNFAATEGTDSPVVFSSVASLNAYLGFGPGSLDAYSEENVDSKYFNIIMGSGGVGRGVKADWKARAAGTYVRIPESDKGAAGNWGPLAGKIVPAHLLVAVKDSTDRTPIVGGFYNGAVSAFKASKTILNPGTQTVNVVSNVTQATILGIPFGTILEAGRIMIYYEVAPEKLTDSEIELAMAFIESGAELGNFANVEIKKFYVEEILSKMSPLPEENTLNKFAGFLQMEKLIGENAPKLAKKVFGKTKDAGVAGFEAAELMYNLGDNMFRMAAFMHKAGELMVNANTDQLTKEIKTISGRYAKESFVDYDVSAKAIKVLRQTALPFISFTAGYIPILAKAIAFKPWLITNFLALATIADFTLSALLADDDEEDRKLGQGELNDRMFGFGPRLFWRLPNFGDDDVPVYLNFGEYVPFYSILKNDLPNPFMGINGFPQAITPSNPFLTAALTMFGFDMYTGESFTDKVKGDPERSQLKEILRRTTDIWLPPFVTAENRDRYMEAVLNNSRRTSTGRDPSVTILIAQKLLGLRIVEADPSEQSLIRNAKASEAMRKYKAAVASVRREVSRFHTYDQDLFNERLGELQDELYEALDEIYGSEE